VGRWTNLRDQTVDHFIHGGVGGRADQNSRALAHRLAVRVHRETYAAAARSLQLLVTPLR